MILAGQDILDTDFVIALTAGETLATRDAVYLKVSDGKAWKTDADDLATIGFIGFVESGVSSGATVKIRVAGIMTGFSALTPGSVYYVSATAGGITDTKPTNFKIVGRAISATVIQIATEPTKRVRVYSTPSASIGGSTTRFDITNPAGTTFRYTFDGTGTDPNLSLANNPIGSYIEFQAQNFAAGNKGRFAVTGAGANYVEVTNASGVAENDKTIGTGFVRLGTIYTKPSNLQHLEIEMVGGGGTADTDNSGASAGYLCKRFEGSEVAAAEMIFIGDVQMSSYFSTTLTCTGAVLNAAGTASGGDLNIDGQAGQASQSISKPSTSSTNYIGGDGGGTPLGAGGKGTRNSGSPGAMGGGAAGHGYGSGGGVSGGAGKQGVVIITEYY